MTCDDAGQVTPGLSPGNDVSCLERTTSTDLRLAMTCDDEGHGTSSQSPGSDVP